jgi:5,10-methylenetetrahydromethanopterin reductase
MQVSCAFPTTMSSPEDIRIAEDLGYARAWLYDTPQQSPDVWMALALAAERTSRIGLGPGVLVPNLRHPMTNAAATATLVGMAPGRVAVSFGTGFTGRRAMGYRAIPWSFMTAYIEAYTGLLRGEIVEWEGAKIQMLQPVGFGAPRPIEVPFLLGAVGPKGIAAAREVGAGVFIAGGPPAAGITPQSGLVFGTVVDDGEDIGSERVMAAAGHGAAVFYHFMYETKLPMDGLPAAEQWVAAYADVPEDERHLAIHDLHLVAVNDRDRPLITSDVLTAMGAAFTPDELRTRLAGMAEAGMTEIAYQPAGPDIPRELEAFADAVNG